MMGLRQQCSRRCSVDKCSKARAAGLLWGLCLWLSSGIPAHAAQLAPIRPFIQLQTSHANYFEKAYEQVFGGPHAAGNASRTTEELDRLLGWLTASKGPSDGVPYVRELHNEDAGGELLQAAVQLADPALNSTGMASLLMHVGALLMHGSSSHGYPACRRLILGGLLKQRMLKGPFQPLPRLLADMVLLQLYLLHRRAAASRGAIQYFHVSKSGGTNMCLTAKANGCATEGFDESSNCKLRDFWDWPRWVTRAGHQELFPLLSAGNKTDLQVDDRWFVNFESEPQQFNCSERADILRQHGYNFHAMEFASPTGSPCRQMTSFMLWRHPMERLQSHMHFVQVCYARAFQLLDLSHSFGTMDADFWRRLLPVGTDNQYVRSLLGARYWQLPLVPITEAHKRSAKAQVLQQDLLLSLEQKSLHDVTFRQGLGWAHAMSHQKVRASGGFWAELFLPHDMHRLSRLNAPDMEVYEFAVALSNLDALVWHAASDMRPDLDLDLSLPNTLTCGYVQPHITSFSGPSEPDAAARADSAGSPAGGSSSSTSGQQPPGDDASSTSDSVTSSNLSNAGRDGTLGGKSAVVGGSSSDAAAGGLPASSTGSKSHTTTRHSRSVQSGRDAHAHAHPHVSRIISQTSRLLNRVMRRHALRHNRQPAHLQDI